MQYCKLLIFLNSSWRNFIDKTRDCQRCFIRQNFIFLEMRCHKNHLKFFFYAERRIKLNKIPFLAPDLAMLSSSLCKCKSFDGCKVCKIVTSASFITYQSSCVIRVIRERLLDKRVFWRVIFSVRDDWCFEKKSLFSITNMFTSLLYVGSDRCHHNDNGIL